MPATSHLSRTRREHTQLRPLARSAQPLADLAVDREHADLERRVERSEQVGERLLGAARPSASV